MADLYNLDAELEQGLRYGDDTVIDNDDNDDDIEVNANTTTTNNDDNDDDEPYGSYSNQTTSFNIPVPDALQEAAMARQKQLNSGNGNDDDEDDNDNEDIRTTKGLWNFQSNDPFSLLDTNTQQVKHNQYEQLQNLSYTKLYNIWVQECHAPELLPYPYDIIQQVRHKLLQYELYIEEKENTDTTNTNNTYSMSQNENLNALIDSLLRIDVERVKFLLSDLLQRRIQKITKYTQYYYKQLTSIQQDDEEELGNDEGNSSSSTKTIH